MITNPSHLAYIVLSPILSTCFALLNAVAIFIFSTRFRLATLALIVLVNICACDIFVCLISNTFYMVNLLHPLHTWSTGSIACKMFKFFTMLSNISQIFLLCVLNADRLRRLVYNNTKQWTKRDGIIFTISCWTLSLILCLPRLVLFDVQAATIKPDSNSSQPLEVYNCKPIGMDSIGYAAITMLTFILAYVLPACFISYTLVRSHVFMWKRRRCIHMTTTSNAVTRMNGKLTRTFNITGALFMIIWTPFFIMSLMDLQDGYKNSTNLVHENFAFRCILLIFGSAKPLIYLVCLDRFRENFRCSRTVGTETSSERSPSTNLHKLSTGSLDNTKDVCESFA